MQNTHKSNRISGKGNLTVWSLGAFPSGRAQRARDDRAVLL